MKFAFSSNAYRNYSIEECIDLIHLAGYDSIEIMCDQPHAFPPISNEKIISIHKSLKKNSMSISNLNGFMLTAIDDFHHPSWIEESKNFRQKRIDHTKNCLYLASQLGAKSVSTEPGGPKTSQSFEKELELFQEGLLEVLPLAEELGINLLVEPEPELLIENSHQFVKFIEKFNSKYLGLNFDIGHFFCVNEKPHKLILDLQDYIKHIHLEDIASSKKHHHLIPGHGVINFKEIFNSLNLINYTGYVTVELYPYQNNPQNAAIESMTYLKSLIENV
ncbi:sugar phosphate isomerase/epimerase [Nitrosopumilus sp.]|nr:sugar phosphate isomerase/epimerase [Nitrosopumilus sp.]|tara:strand:- start:552 stop:1379 length:828 start_codon:yes stop_codon:yes gene_type:complete